MPFKSKQQEKWMYANKPKMAKEWMSMTRDPKSLPKKVHKSSVKSAAKRAGF